MEIKLSEHIDNYDILDDMIEQDGEDAFFEAIRSIIMFDNHDLVKGLKEIIEKWEDEHGE